MSESSRKLQVGAYWLLAGGFILSALANMKNGVEGPFEPGVRGLGEGEAKKPLPAGAKKPLGKPKMKQYDIEDIDDRVALIGGLIRKGSLSADLRERTVEILAQKCDVLGRVDNKAGARWCVPEKDCLAEVKALFEAVRNPKSKYAVRYTRDALLADVFTAPERTLLKSHGGDCDDYVITLGSMLMAVGHQVKLRVIATRRNGVDDRIAPWSHIYLITPTDFDNPRKWISVDASMDKPLGWEAPGAAQVAATGKPAGIVARVRDYDVVKPGEVT